MFQGNPSSYRHPLVTWRAAGKSPWLWSAGRSIDYLVENVQMWKQQYLVDHFLNGKPGVCQSMLVCPWVWCHLMLLEIPRPWRFLAGNINKCRIFLLHAMFAGEIRRVKDVNLPCGNLSHSYGRAAWKYLVIGKSSNSMDHGFHSYVKNC